MGKSSSGKAEVTEYRMSMHIGVALELDSVNKIIVDEKVAWQGNVSNNTALSINRPDIFGGEKKEGGLVGVIEVLLGRANQILPAQVAARYGRAPNDCPAFRGLTTLMFRGSNQVSTGNFNVWEYLAGNWGGNVGGNGFLFKHNSPIIAQKIEVEGTCKPKAALNPAYAMIGPDANPIHMLYEALIDDEFGMGGSPDAIAIDTFEAAAETLFNENFGLTILWMRQSSIETLVNEILEHIQATFFADPTTGLLSVKLHRDDYDVENLFIISPDNARLSKYRVRSPGEIVNSLTVSWTNPISEKSESITAHDLASIANQGGESVPGSRDYYGIRNADLARRVLARDLREATAPLVSCEAVIDRSAWHLKPGDVVLLNWPRRNLYGLVMRVGKVNYGKPGSTSVRVPLLQDVFSLSHPPIVIDPGTGWENPSSEPQPLTMQLATLPAYFSRNASLQPNPVDLVEPEVLVMALADSQDDDSLDYELIAQTPGPSGAPVPLSKGAMTMTPLAYLGAGLAAAATSELPASLFPDINWGPTVGGFLFIGYGDINQEIALVTGITATGWTINRGCLDTTPRTWAAGTPVWAVNAGSSIVDVQTIHAAGETVTYRGLDRTSQGLLAYADAPDESITLTERPHLPLRPANVKVGGVGFGSYALNGATQFTVSWATRNRLLEDTQVLAWTDGPVAPEYRQETVVSVYDVATNALIVEHAYLWTETEITFQKAEFDRYGSIRVVVWSRRDDVVSLNGHSVVVTGFAASAGAGGPSAPGGRTPPPSPHTAPGVGAFTAVASTEASPTGAKIPVIEISGQQDNAAAAAMLARYKIPAASEWAVTGQVALNQEPISFTISGLQGETAYQVGVAYVVDGIVGQFRALPNVTTGAVISSDSLALGGQEAVAILGTLAAIPGQIDAAIVAADAALATAVGNLNLALGGLDLRLDEVELDIDDPATGLKVRVGANETATAAGAARISVVEQQVQTPGTGLLARAASLETATANLQTGKADASRVTTLEAQVNTPTTGLLARAASLETATANLQTGKADASRVTSLEARANTGANLIRNPSGREGLAGWEQNGLANAFYAVEDATWGWWIRTTWAGVTPYRGLRTAPIKGGYGNSYTLSGRAFVQFPVSGTSSLRLYGYTDEAGTTGETYLTGHTFDANSTHSWPNPLPPLTATTPANIRALRVYAEVAAGTDGGAYGDLGFWNLKLERGGVATLFTDDASLTGLAGRASNVEARALTLETATANLQTGKADASRVTTLEAQVQTGGTGLLARTTSLETATANLQTGKADASRVTSLEARASANANRIRNPSGLEGLSAWHDAAALGWSTVPNNRFGQWILTSFTGAVGLNRSVYQVVNLQPGVWTLSGRYALQGLTGGLAAMNVVFWGAGGNYISETQLNLPTANVDGGDFTPHTFTAPAGTSYVWVRPLLTNASGSPVTAYFGFYRLKLEEGPTATVFTDDASNSALQARTASLETATANLQTGKADASRVSIVEARLVRNHNLIRNPSGREGTRYWDFFNEPIVAATDLTFGPWFRHRFDNQGDHYATMRSHPFQGGYGGTWTLSGEGFQSGLGGAYCDIGVYGYTDEAGTQGEVRCSPSFNTIGLGPNIGRFKFPQQTFTAPANIVSFRVWWQMRLTSPGGYSDVGIWNLKLEPGAVATVFSDDAGQTALHARVVQEESATVDLMGRTMARWAIGAAVPGADAFIEARAETSPGATPTSSVAIGARQFAVYNQSGGQWLKALSVENGNVILSGGLQAGAFIRLGNGQGWPVALRPVDFSAGDGEAVNFGTDLGGLPSLQFFMNNLLPLAAGETYDVKAVNLTATGFTLWAKINVPGTPTSYDRTAAFTTSAFGSGGIAISKSADPNAADGSYRIMGSGYNHHEIVGQGSGQVMDTETYDYVYGEVQVFVKKAGVWSYAASVYASSMVDRRNYPQGQFQHVSGAFTFDSDVQLGDGVQEVGVRHATPDSYAYVTGFSHLIWTAPGTAAGVRTALAAGTKTKTRVTPP